MWYEILIGWSLRLIKRRRKFFAVKAELSQVCVADFLIKSVFVFKNAKEAE